jgi:thiamine-phosphate pyrophosphorylase
MIARRAIDLSLYLVIGPDTTMGRPLSEVVLAAIDGGVTVVQLRQKRGTTRAFVEEARALMALLRPLGVPLIVNDRVDVALAASADGVHVGQDDMCPADVRRLVGPSSIVGLSVTNLAEAHAVDATLVDYVGIGPVFATPTKPDAAPPLGLVGAAELCRALRVPAVAIGGIDCDNVGHVRAVGVQGVAVVSAIGSAAHPGEAAALLAAPLRPMTVEHCR